MIFGESHTRSGVDGYNHIQVDLRRVFRGLPDGLNMEKDSGSFGRAMRIQDVDPYSHSTRLCIATYDLLVPLSSPPHDINTIVS